MRTKWIYTMFVLALSLFTSCNNEVDEAAGNKKTRTVVFRLSVDDAVGSRAGTWGDTYNKPNANNLPFDTRIDLNKLQIVVYKASDNSWVGKVRNVLYWQTGNNDTETNDVVEYELVGDLSHVTTMTDNTEYKYVVLANCPEVAEKTSMENLGKLIYQISSIGYDTGYIPMWGVQTKTLGSAELQDLGTIDLLRAVAKVEVVMGSNVTGYTLKSVGLTCYNDYGYCLPLGHGDFSFTKQLNQETLMKEYRHRVLPTDPYGFNQVDGSQSFFIYIPEYDNLLPSKDEEAIIKLKVQHGNDENDIHDYSIKFTDYNIGTIVRNHIYRFTIENVHAGNLVLNYEVADWNWESSNDWTLDFAYPTYVNPVQPIENIDDNDNNNRSYPWSPNMSYTSNENGAFVCCFQMTAPTGQVWTPVLKGGNNLADIKVYKYGESTPLFDTTDPNPQLGITASNDWYVIKVIPNKARTDAIVELGITYTQTWMGLSGSRYLLINGEGTNHYWVYSGDNELDPRLVRIHQVQ